MTDTPPERENPPAACVAQTIYVPVATQIRLAAMAHGFLYSLGLRVVHHAPANISPIIPCADTALMLSIDSDVASFIPPVINTNADCSAKKPRTRLRSILMRAAYRGAAKCPMTLSRQQGSALVPQLWLFVAGLQY
jgi:hypothetical protein